jgi:hypothetical protein
MIGFKDEIESGREHRGTENAAEDPSAESDVAGPFFHD